MKQAFIFTKEKTYNKFMRKFEKAGLLWLSGNKPTCCENFEEIATNGKITVLIKNNKLTYADADFFLNYKGTYYRDYDLVYDQHRRNGKKAKRIDWDPFTNGIELYEHGQLVKSVCDIRYIINEEYNLIYDEQWGK